MKAKRLLNLWDTSSRFGVYSLIIEKSLKNIRKFLTSSVSWKNVSIQNKMYNQILADCHLKRDGVININSFDRHPSLFLNGFKKLGLIYPKTHQLTPVSTTYLFNLRHSINSADKLEQLFGLRNINLPFSRQLLKLRIYHSKQNLNYIQPLYFMILMLLTYKHMNTKHFYNIFVLLPKLKWTKQNLSKVILGYKNVIKHQYSFTKYLQLYFFSASYDKNTIIHTIKNCNQSDFNFTNFRKIFINGRSIKSIKLYASFVKLLLKYRQHDYQNAKEKYQIEDSLLKLSRKQPLKKAFGFGKEPFHCKSHESFSKKYNSHKLLSGSILNIYNIFKLSKTSDIIREYSNMNRKIINLSKLFLQSPNGITLNNYAIWNQLKSKLQANFIGKGKNIHFTDSQSLQTILGLNNTSLNNMLCNVENEYHVHSYHALLQKLNAVQVNEFNNNIEKSFSINKVIKLLQLFDKRTFCKPSKQESYDKIIQTLSSSQATVPTVCEFIIGLAWWFLSDKTLDIYDAYNLIMNGEYRPVHAAPGGMGDIAINYHNHYHLLIEVTLQNINAQKKGEIEPVTRHSVNYKAENFYKDRKSKTETIFIAPAISQNTRNDFLSSANRPKIDSEHHELSVNGVNIFCVTFTDLIHALQKHRENPKYNTQSFLKELRKTFKVQACQQARIIYENAFNL